MGQKANAVSLGTRQVTTGSGKSSRTERYVFYQFQAGGRKYEGSSRVHNEDFAAGQVVPDVRYLAADPSINRNAGAFALLTEIAVSGVVGLLFLAAGLGILWLIFLRPAPPELGVRRGDQIKGSHS